jgi:integrase
MRAEAIGETRVREYGDYWLAKRSDSPSYYICWYDARFRKVIRRTTGCADFQDADEVLRFTYLRNPRSLRPGEPALLEVLSWYWAGHASKVNKPSSNATALRHWLEYFDHRTAIIKLEPTEIFKFWDHLRTIGLSEGSISRITALGRAAISRATAHGLILDAPKIPSNLRGVDLSYVPPMGRPLSMKEMAALFAAPKPPYLQVFLMIMANTLCRTSAALELGPAQVEFEYGVVHLNPKGRRQTKKRRPTVPLTKTLRRTLEALSGERYVLRKGLPIENIYPAWQRLVRDAGFATGSRITPYSIRHSMARSLRSRRVPMEQLSVFMGHRPDGASPMTVRYAPYDPDFLSDAANKIDTYFDEILAL